MPTTIRNLTVAIKIGGKDIILDSDSINQEPGNVENTISGLLAQGFSFKMQKGTSVSVTVGELIGWFESNFRGNSGGIDHVSNLGSNVRGFIDTATTTPASPSAGWEDGVSLELRDLSFSARKPSSAPTEISFGFTIKVALDQSFYDDLGLDGITDIISVTSVGFSMAYSNS